MSCGSVLAIERRHLKTEAVARQQRRSVLHTLGLARTYSGQRVVRAAACYWKRKVVMWWYLVAESQEMLVVAIKAICSVCDTTHKVLSAGVVP